MTSGRVAITASMCLMHVLIRFSVLQFALPYPRTRRRRDSAHNTIHLLAGTLVEEKVQKGLLRREEDLYATECR